MDERIARLRRKVSETPANPGVYIHHDAHRKVLYVGKARNLQARLRSYFFGLERHPPKTRALVSRICDFEVILTTNEHESLVLENNLIKHHRPPYNILLRDDKTYPFLRLHPKEPWPRLVLTRRRRDDGALYFGPFTNGSLMHRLLAVVNRYFPLVKCPPSIFRTARRPCNYYHIGKCLGPCSLEVSRDEYGKIVDHVVAILEGRSASVAERLLVEMQLASERLEFERAALLRDQIQAVRDVASQKQSVFLAPGLNLDAIGSSWHGSSVCFFVSSIRDGKLISGENFVLESALESRGIEEGIEGDASNEGNIRAELTEAFLCQFYSRREVPPVVFCPAVTQCLQVSRRDVVRALLESLRAARPDSSSEVSLAGAVSDLRSVLSREGVAWKSMSIKLRSIMASSDENARERYLDHQRLDERSRRALLALQETLGLASPPVWLECFDISTTQGVETVASQVVFREGIPAKSDYRRYIIREVSGQDDFASLREVMRRRFKEERRHEVPDVIFVDGGEPQVREVAWTLKSLGLGRVTLVGIAKARTEREFQSSTVSSTQERLVVPLRDDSGELEPGGEPRTIPLKPGSEVFRMVTHMRDEAHRFAITLHRKRRESLARQSVLQRISGLGPKRRKKLLEVYADLQTIAGEAPGELASKVGIPLSLALTVQETVREALRNTSQ